MTVKNFDSNKTMEWKPFDPKRPTRLPHPDFLRVEAFFKQLSKKIESQVLNEYNADWRIQLRDVSQESVSNYLKSLPTGAYITTFTHRQSFNQGVLAFDPAPLHSALKQVSGHSDLIQRSDGQLTSFEQALTRKFVQLFLTTCEQTLEGDHEFIIDTLAKKHTILDRDPWTNCIVARIFVRTTPLPGIVTFALPFGIVKHLINNFPDPKKTKKKDPSTLIEPLRMTFQAVLGNSELSLSELTSLKEGDILPLDHLSSEPIELKIAGQTVFNGWLGSAGKNKAVKIQAAPTHPKGDSYE